ncbi:MAG: Mammalian cell entry related domain protein [Firmicutes bacterium]|nr:Mammalian cell entry related domain protein [Bacillota bacterium]
MSKEAKVGAVVLCGLLLLAYMIIHLGGFTIGDRGYPIDVVYTQVGGLKPGNAVRFAGVDVGTVETVAVVSEGVRVRAHLNPGVRIPVESKFGIGSDGLLGEKFIDIVPPRPHGDAFLPRKGAVVQGESPQGLEQLVGSVNQLVKSVQEVIGDEKARTAFRETIFNARDITANLNELSAVLARVAVQNEGEMNALVANLSSMSVRLNAVATRMDSMLAEVDNNGRTAGDLREIIQNLKSTSARVERMAASMEGVVTDPQTSHNIKETLKNAREASEKANTMLRKVEQVSVEPGIEVLYNSDSGKYSSNADLRVSTSPQSFAVIGVRDIGGESDAANKLNLQVGHNVGEWSQRAGIVDGKAGIGVDKQIGGQMKLSLDVYDPNDVRVKLRSQYQVAPDTFVVAQTDSLNKNPDKNLYFGVRRSF